MATRAPGVATAEPGRTAPLDRPATPRGPPGTWPTTAWSESAGYDRSASSSHLVEEGLEVEDCVEHRPPRHHEVPVQAVDMYIHHELLFDWTLEHQHQKHEVLANAGA